MKNKFFYTLIAAVLVGFTSCVDLDRYPLEELSDASYWKTAKDAEMAVSELYNYWNDDRFIIDIDYATCSDDAMHGIKWAESNIAYGVYDPADFDWYEEYSYIRKANLVLQKIDDVPNYAQAEKDKVLGQAYFFRAYFYWMLIRQFGDVPYADHPLSIAEESTISRTPRAEVYAKVMEDFDKAIDKLPQTWGAADAGRVTKGAALAMKAQCAIYYHDYQVAADCSKQVIDSNLYELWDKDNTGKYAQLFWEVSDGCSENILYRQFEAVTKGSYVMGWECFPTLGWGGIDPSQSLVDAFEDINGAPISKSTIYDETKPFENRDPRLEACVLHDGETLYDVEVKTAPVAASGNTGVGNHGDATGTGYYQQKWLDPSIDPSTDGWDMGKDLVIIRYAEVLLTYAEAMNELKGLDDSAFAAVNQVRARVGMPALQKTDASLPTYCGDQDALRQRIRNEWRVEFALEGGKRMWDVRRWGIAKEVLNQPLLGMKYTLNDDGTCTLYVGENIVWNDDPNRYQDHNYVFPVPQSERDLNPNLTQNPGYPD